MKTSPFAVLEQDVAASFGVPQKKIAAVRVGGLVRGADWQHAGGAVRYSEEGLAKLYAALKVPPAADHSAPNGQDPAPAGAPETSPAESASTALVRLPLQAGDVHELVVTRTFAHNRRIIDAVRGTTIVRVRVNDSVKLRPGMTLKCAFLQGDLWELAERLPRWPGKR